MARVRLTKDAKAEPQDPAANHPGYTPTWRGLTERQWFISLLVAAGLLMLITFRGCILPSGVGPKSKPPAKATPTPGATVQPAAGTEYTVQAGDTLSAIAKKFNVSVDALAQANDIDLNNRVILRVGDKLKIPQS